MELGFVLDNLKEVHRNSFLWTSYCQNLSVLPLDTSNAFFLVREWVMEQLHLCLQSCVGPFNLEKKTSKNFRG